MSNRHILSFIFGAITGAVVAYTYFSSKYAKDEPEKANDIPEQPQEQKQTPEQNEESEHGISEGFVDEKDLPEGYSHKNVSFKELQEYAKQATDYTSYSQTAERPDVPAPPVNNGIPDQKPKIISFDEYEAGEGKYAHDSLLYFVESKTLTNEQEELIADPDLLIGDTLLAPGAIDGMCVIVRNYTLAIDYEITIVAGSYGA